MPMNMMDNKRIAVILAGKLGKKEEASKEPEMKKESSDDMPQPDIAAAKALVSAIESRDWEKIVASFKNMMECCDMMDTSEDDEDME